MIRSAALTSTVLLSACALTVTTPPPRLEFTGSDCTARPQLGAAANLSPPKKQRTFTTSISIDEETLCTTVDNRNTPYAIIEIPDEKTGKTITIGSLIEPGRIFSPKIHTLDEDGNIIREYDFEDFYYRGGALSVQFQPREPEKYILVTANHDAIGQSYNSITIGVSSGATYASGSSLSYNFGTETRGEAVFSYFGMVTATVHDNSPPPQE